MNIFYLDSDPKLAARYHCDTHVNAMCRETTQLLSSAHRVLDGDDKADALGMMRIPSENHPSAVWARSSAANYTWLAALNYWLHEEFLFRRFHGRSDDRLVEILHTLPDGINHDIPFFEPPKVMPPHLHCQSAVESYRRYYRIKRAAKIVKYQWGRRPPKWL